MNALTRSAVPGTGTLRSSWRAESRMKCSAACTTLGVSAVTITRRTAECRGGSSSPRMRSSNGTYTPGAFIPVALEKASVSRSAARHSACRVT